MVTIGQTITVNKVEGKTARRGTKQNTVYTITKVCNTKCFYEAVNNKGKQFTLVIGTGNGLLGIISNSGSRMSWTPNFIIN